MTHPVTNVPGTDLSDLLAPHGARRQPMRGFDDEFIDLPDYIVRITHRIWEQRNIHRIYDYYSSDCAVHGSRGTITGVEAHVNGTIATLHSFPDRRLIADDVIWGGDDVRGYYSSHRICNLGTNLGTTGYGAPTGRKMRWIGIADCLCLENRIIEEWLVRDELGILLQLGHEVQPIVRRIAEGMPAAFADEARALIATRATNQATPLRATPDDDIEAFVRGIYHNLWNARKLSEVFERWVYTHRGHSSGGRELYGHADQLAFVNDWLTAFPDGVFSIDHFCAVPNPGGGWRTAIRWRFAGTHRGSGPFGSASHKPVLVKGMTHDTVLNGRIVESWVVYDELALMAQVL